MSKRILAFCTALLIAGCRAQTVAELPTLAVLPTLTTAPPPQSSPQRLTFWQVAESTLESSQQVDRWQFAASAGDPIRLSVLGPVTLALYAPDGSALGSGATLELTLSADGLYSVEVQSAAGDTGRYQLGLGYTDRPNPADYTATPPPVTVGVPTPTPIFEALGVLISPLEADAAVAETFLRGPVQPHVYTFEGQAGHYATIQMRRVSGTVDPVLRLYGPDGEPLAVDDNSGGNRTALLRNIPLRQAGQYSLQAEGGGGPGEYEIRLMTGERPVPVTPTIIAPPTATPFNPVLSLTPAPAVPDMLLEPYVPVIGNLDRPGAVNRHIITIGASDYISIGVRKLQPDNPLRPVVEVFNPAGELVGTATGGTSNPSAAALIQLLPVTEPGTYSIFVTGEGSQNGHYVISYGQGTVYEEIPRGPALADTPYDGHIDRRGVRDSWQVTLSAGDVITVAASPLTASLDPVIELVGPDGTLIASDDNSGGFPNAFIEQVRAPVSGQYRLQVSASGGGSAGPYRLIWRYLNIAPTPTFDPPRILLFNVEDSVPEGAYAFFPFQGGAGQRVRVRVTAQPGSGFDPVAALIGPDGREIAMGDDENGLNPQFSADLPVDGTYQVRVNGYLSGGAFELVVERLL